MASAVRIAPTLSTLSFAGGDAVSFSLLTTCVVCLAPLAQGAIVLTQTVCPLAGTYIDMVHPKCQDVRLLARKADLELLPRQLSPLKYNILTPDTRVMELDVAFFRGVNERFLYSMTANFVFVDVAGNKALTYPHAPHVRIPYQLGVASTHSFSATEYLVRELTVAGAEYGNRPELVRSMPFDEFRQLFQFTVCCKLEASRTEAAIHERLSERWSRAPDGRRDITRGGMPLDRTLLEQGDWTFSKSRLWYQAAAGSHCYYVVGVLVPDDEHLQTIYAEFCSESKSWYTWTKDVQDKFIGMATIAADAVAKRVVTQLAACVGAKAGHMIMTPVSIVRIGPAEKRGFDALRRVQSVRVMRYICNSQPMQPLPGYRSPSDRPVLGGVVIPPVGSLAFPVLYEVDCTDFDKSMWSSLLMPTVIEPNEFKQLYSNVPVLKTLDANNAAYALPVYVE